MNHQEIKPHAGLQPYIHSFWELKGSCNEGKWERNFPDGCGGLVINLGSTCITDNGSVSMDFGKTYAVGASTSFKDTFIDADTHLFGVCLKPAAFSNFYTYVAQHELTDQTVELEKGLSIQLDKLVKSSGDYLNKFFQDRLAVGNEQLRSVIADIHRFKGLSSIADIAKRNFTTVRQLERSFKVRVGLSPKAYSNIVRFQNALSVIKDPDQEQSLLSIAVDCGFYDHAHLANEIRRNTGLPPSQL